MNSPEVRCSHAEMIRVGDLRPHPQNPNQHPPEQIALLGKIIGHQGWRRPIRVSKLSGFITAGHGALLAAKAKGWESVPVDFQEYETTEDEKADLLADNKIAELSEMDQDAIDRLLEEIGDIELAGFFDEDEEEEKSPDPEIPFSEVLGEANNFIVLKFDNDVDWLQALTHFGLDTVVSKRMNGKPHSRGTGRVAGGAVEEYEIHTTVGQRSVKNMTLEDLRTHRRWVIGQVDKERVAAGKRPLSNNRWKKVRSHL
jgi:hypothetical protein